MSTQDGEVEVPSTIQGRAEARLRQSPELGAYPITCRFNEGTLTLCGRVPRYSLKQAARSLVDRIDGVRAVDNRIDVIPLPIAEGPG